MRDEENQKTEVEDCGLSTLHTTHHHHHHGLEGHFSPWSSYLKMDLKSEFFDFFQPICFWKAETKLEMNLLEFLRSEVI